MQLFMGDPSGYRIIYFSKEYTPLQVPSSLHSVLIIIFIKTLFSDPWHISL